MRPAVLTVAIVLASCGKAPVDRCAIYGPTAGVEKPKSLGDYAYNSDTCVYNNAHAFAKSGESVAVVAQATVYSCAGAVSQQALQANIEHEPFNQGEVLEDLRRQAFAEVVRIRADGCSK